MKIIDVEREQINFLKENGIEDSSIIIKELLCFLLQVDKVYLITHSNEEMDKEVYIKVVQNTKKIVGGKPIQYITNNQEFMKMNFFVDENVLIPQPDTEILVYEVLKICKEYSNGVNILDLCTGSGAIAVSLDRILRKNCVDAKICASDISKQALKIARKNSENNNANVKIIESDLLENIEYKKFDIIVSNPPYIRTDEIKNLSKQVKEEPYIALNGGIDGLHFYRKIIKEAKGYIKNNGYLCLEIGYNQMESVLGIFKENKEYKNLKQVKDWSGNDRCIIAQKLE